MFGVPERRRQCKFAGLTEIQFTGESYVAIGGMIEFIIHLKILMQIRPAIARPYKTAGHAEKRHRGGHGEPHSLLARHQHPLTVRRGDVARVSESAYLQMR